MENIQQVIDYLENAEINCENIEKIYRPAFGCATIVKQQIQSALKLLNAEEDRIKICYCSECCLYH